MSRRRAIRLGAATGVAALAGVTARADQPPRQKPKSNAEPAVASTAAAESHGAKELFAVVNHEGRLRRGSHAVSSKCLERGVYEVIFDRDVRRGVYLVTPGGEGYEGIPPAAIASVIGRSCDPRGVVVYVADASGDPIETGFHLLVVCPESFA
jgi:hypothetical protein